jgi:hypothetical protein
MVEALHSMTVSSKRTESRRIAVWLSFFLTDLFCVNLEGWRILVLGISLDIFGDA